MFVLLIQTYSHTNQAYIGVRFRRVTESHPHTLQIIPTPEMDTAVDLDVTTRRPSSRFLLENSGEHMNRRNLLNFNLCGRGTAPNYDCKNRYPLFKNATCCWSYGSRLCFDVGGNYDYMCGSCGNRCSFGLHCCSGKCVNQLTNRKHCGGCGRICKNGVPCTHGLCSYGGDRDTD